MIMCMIFGTVALWRYNNNRKSNRNKVTSELADSETVIITKVGSELGDDEPVVTK